MSLGSKVSNFVQQFMSLVLSEKYEVSLYKFYPQKCIEKAELNIPVVVTGSIFSRLDIILL